MSKAEKLRDKILSGKSDRNIRFADLCKFVEALGFVCSSTATSHHVYSRPDVVEILNFQDDAGSAKPYQVKQARKIVEKYNL